MLYQSGGVWISSGITQYKTNEIGLIRYLVYGASDILRGRGAAKFRKIHKNTQNTATFGKNLIKQMSVQHI